MKLGIVVLVLCGVIAVFGGLAVGEAYKSSHIRPASPSPDVVLPSVPVEPTSAPETSDAADPSADPASPSMRAHTRGVVPSPTRARTTTPAPTPTRHVVAPPATTQAAPEAYYANCAAARAAGAAPIHQGDPGYSSKLDRDGDGIACEN